MTPSKPKSIEIIEPENSDMTVELQLLNLKLKKLKKKLRKRSNYRR